VEVVNTFTKLANFKASFLPTLNPRDKKQVRALSGKTRFNLK
jgi:hypothetical protein